MKRNQSTQSASQVLEPVAVAPSETPFSYRDYGEARATLLTAIQRGPFYGLVTGPSGTGKTTLFRELDATLDRHHQILYVSASRASLLAITQSMARKVHVTPRRSCLSTAQELVAALRAQPVHCVLCVDEADRLDSETLGELRLVPEADLGSRQAFSVVLLGLPDLVTRLDAQELFPLKRRIRVRVTLTGLRRDELDAFLAHRFGTVQALRLPPEVRGEIFEHAQGAPGVIEDVARLALARAVEGVVGEVHLRGAFDELHL